MLFIGLLDCRVSLHTLDIDLWKLNKLQVQFAHLVTVLLHIFLTKQGQK
jgi:hypothetical protein